jgi:hypothetical protein
MMNTPQKPQLHKHSVSVSELVSLVARHDGGTTWWMSDFYDDFCELYNLNPNLIKPNSNRIRSELNKLVKAGFLESSKIGTGHGGKNLYGFRSCCSWSVVAER